MGFAVIKKRVRKLKSQSGISLVAAIFITILLTTISVVTLSVVVTDNRMTANNIEASQAFWASEAGIERALLWLRNQDTPPSGTSPFTLYDNQTIGSGTYSVIIDPADDNPNHYIKQYTIESTGNGGVVSRQLQIQVRMSTFGKYAYLSGNENGSIWFYTGDVIEGPLHSNDQISIMGSPTFLGKVTSSYASFVHGSVFHPVFRDGYQLGVPPITFPTSDEVLNNYYIENGSPPPLIIDASGKKHARIVFNSNGEITYSVWHRKNHHTVYDIQNATANVSDLNGVIYVTDDVRLKGTLKGRLSVFATGNIFIVDDIRYSRAKPNGEPEENCTDMLGIISTKNVIVADTPPNRDNVVIDGAILALGNSFYVQNYRNGSPRGNLTIWGSLSQVVRGPVGTFSWDGSTTGYHKDYHYDQRLESQIPPYYPTTGVYDVTAWREMMY